MGEVLVKLTLVVLLGAGSLSWAQDPPKAEPAAAHPTVDPRRVDEATKKGIQFLRGAASPRHADAKIVDSDELILWTMVHAGLPQSDPKFQELFRKMLQAPLERSYKVALQAMILEELGRVRYQGRIAQCAQFLVDNQCLNGQWSYGQPTLLSDDIPLDAGRPDVATPSKDGDGGLPRKPRILKKVAVRKARDGPAAGDNSNSQYAALGLRACTDAGVLIPKEVPELARKWWVESQNLGEGKDNGYGGVRGWCYKEKEGDPAYGSMTAGAVGALLIYDHLLHVDWKRDSAIKGGMSWLAGHFSARSNPDVPKRYGETAQYYYFLYAIERAGLLCGMERFGRHEWYFEGARAILEAQREDGSWATSEGSTVTWDTCFAILFLRRATRPLDVPSVDRYVPGSPKENSPDPK